MTQSEFNFSAPPVREVGLSVVTAGQVMDAYDIHEIHDLFRARFPRWEAQPSFMGYPPFPAPSAQLQQQAGFFMGPTSPVPRYWFLDETGTNLTQVQNNFLARNWRQLTFSPAESEPYPGYDELKKDFIGQIDALAGWNAKAGREMPNPASCELLYDNLIPLLTDEGDNLKMGDVVPMLVNERPLSAFSMNWFEHISPGENSNTQPTDFQVSMNVLAIPLSSRGPYPYVKLMFVARSVQSSWQGVYDFFDAAHAHVRVRLLELTTRSAQERWNKA